MVLAKFENAELGIEATVAKNERGFYVALRDTDADEFVPFGVIYQTIDRAIDEAQKAVL